MSGESTAEKGYGDRECRGCKLVDGANNLYFYLCQGMVGYTELHIKAIQNHDLTGACEYEEMVQAIWQKLQCEPGKERVDNLMIPGLLRQMSLPEAD